MKKRFGKHGGKGENAKNKHFLLCPLHFLLFQKESRVNSLASNSVLCKCFQFEQV